MELYQMGEKEKRFADMIWDKVPAHSNAVISDACEEFGWAKTTAYTVLKRLCQKGLFQNENSEVTALVSKKEYLAEKSKEIVNGSFDGSLPDFVAAFLSKDKLSAADAGRIHKMVEDCTG